MGILERIAGTARMGARADAIEEDTRWWRRSEVERSSFAEVPFFIGDLEALEGFPKGREPEVIVVQDVHLGGSL